MRQIEVLIVDDSPVAREILVEVLSSDPEIHIAGTASNGREALLFLQTRNVDVITMDVIMPEMDGFAATRAIMETKPTPIVIISSSYKDEEVAKSFKAIEAGAVAILSKPGNVTDLQAFEKSVREVREMVKTMAGVKVVKRWPVKASGLGLPEKKSGVFSVSGNQRDIKVAAIGASTGGPIAIRQIFSQLPPQLPVPLLLVQHITGSFLEGMLKWLSQSTGFAFKTAENGETAKPGFVYVAPDRFHMTIDAAAVIRLSACPDSEILCPSVDNLFFSVAQHFGKESIGILLTGMGGDGSRGMKALKNRGAFTIAQNEETCVVYGMPAEAVKLDAVDFLLPLEQIAPRMLSLLGVGSTKKTLAETIHGK